MKPTRPSFIDQHLDGVFAFVRRYCHNTGCAPSLREIAAGCYLSVSTVLRCLDRLEAQGRIVRYHGQARGIRLVPEPPEDRSG